MTIDNFYSQIEKSNFYLGMISAVFRENSIIQVENLSLLNHRKIKLETLTPNTINYFVVIDSTKGLFIGKTYQSKVNSSDSVHESMNKGIKEDIYPEIAVDVVGILSDNNNKFTLTGFKTVGITDKVYIANKFLVRKFLKSIEINDYIYTDMDGNKKGQKPLKKIAKLETFDSEYLSLCPNTLFDRHLITIGTTNSGKSTSALSILGKMIENNHKILLIDPVGEYKNSFSDSEVIKITLGINAFLPIGKISMQQWSMIFQTNDGTQDTILSKAIKSLRFKWINEPDRTYVKVGKAIRQVAIDMASVSSKSISGSFNLTLLPEQINAESITEGKHGLYIEDSFRAGVNSWLSEKVANILENSSFTNFFSSCDKKQNLLSKIDEFLSNAESSLYIDTSKIGTTDGIGAMIIDLISNYIINKQKQNINPFVMYIDEVHRYTEEKNNYRYQNGLISIVREGRKKGIFLFLTTQNPKDVPEVLLGQIGTMIIHRLTHLEELKAIQNQVQQNTLTQIKKLNQGEAVLTSINLLQDITVRFEKSKRPHDNETPLL